MPPGIGYEDENVDWREFLRRFLEERPYGPTPDSGPMRAERWQEHADNFSQGIVDTEDMFMRPFQAFFGVDPELRGHPNSTRNKNMYPGVPGIGRSSPIAPGQIRASKPPGLASLMPGGPFPGREGLPPKFPQGAGGSVGVPGGLSPQKRAMIQSQMIRENFDPSQARSPIRMKGSFVQGPPRPNMMPKRKWFNKRRLQRQPQPQPRRQFNKRQLQPQSRVPNIREILNK